MQKLTRRAAIIAGTLMGSVLLAGCSGGETAASNNASDLALESERLPVHVLITQPVGKAVPADYAKQLAAARNAGGASDVLLLKSKPSVEGPIGFESLAVVEFKDEAAYEKWSSEGAAKLGADLIVRRADLIVDDRARSRAGKPAFAVSHYEALLPAPDYAAYTEAYITPNMNGQKAGGVMTGYAMYYEREPVPGTKGNRTILIKQYVDEAAFDRSEAIKGKVKAELLKDPEWKRINDIKDTLRKDISGTLASPVTVQ